MSVFFYIPLLHREYVTTTLPPHVAFASPGIRGLSDRTPSSPAEAAFLSSLPLSPAQARAALEEMLTFGETTPQAALRTNKADIVVQTSSRKLAPDERAALETFSNSGNIENEPSIQPSAWLTPRPSEEQIRQSLINCQKTLMLAYHLEERSHEIRELEAVYKEAQSSLQTILGENDAPPRAPKNFDQQSGMPTKRAAAGATASTAAGAQADCPWRMIVDAVLPFLPHNTTLFTDNPLMINDLREAGMLQPLPEDKGASCADWPVELTAGLLWVKIPAWRLVGRRGPALDHPWLESEIEILVARPKDGWIPAVPTEHSNPVAGADK